MDLVQVGQNLYQHEVEKQRWQAEMVHRSREARWRRLDELRRSVDERVEQLKALSEISALIAGFAMVTMVEVTIPQDLSTGILISTGVVASGVIGCMLYVMISSIFLLLICYDLIKSDTKNKQVTEYNLPQDEYLNGKKLNLFDIMWQRYKNQWGLVVQVFVIGCLLFPVLIALTSWIVFWEHDSREAAGTAVTTISFVILFLLFRRFQKDSNYINAQDKFSTENQEVSEDATASGSEHVHGDGSNENENENVNENLDHNDEHHNNPGVPPVRRVLSSRERARERARGHAAPTSSDGSAAGMSRNEAEHDGHDDRAEVHRVFQEKLQQAKVLMEELRVMLEENHQHQEPPLAYMRYVDQQVEVGALEQDIELLETDARNNYTQS